MSISNMKERCNGATQAVMRLSCKLLEPGEQMIRLCRFVLGGYADQPEEVVEARVRQSIQEITGSGLPEVLEPSYWNSLEGRSLVLKLTKKLDERGTESIVLKPRGS